MLVRSKHRLRLQEDKAKVKDWKARVIKIITTLKLMTTSTAQHPAHPTTRSKSLTNVGVDIDRDIFASNKLVFGDDGFGPSNQA